MAELVADGYYVYVDTHTIGIPESVVESGNTDAIFDYVKNRLGITINRRYVLKEEN